MMEMTIYNSAKQRLETVDSEITEENSTWFDGFTDNGPIYRITDFEGGLLIKRGRYDYPIWFYDVSRDDINHDQKKAQELLLQLEY